MPDKTSALDKLVNDLKELGFNDPRISESTVSKLSELDSFGICDGGCIAISPVPPCDACCVSKSPA
ncbi:MAG: hypothetical protein Q8878_03070 [Bacillota bacterium]|nr:hypothetical protein [Bacillota bacterium]